MDIIDILTALNNALQAIVNLVQFGQIVASGTPSSNPATQQQLASVEATLETLGQEILQSSAQILAALSTLSQEVFGNQMTSELSYADQAGIALAEWQQNQSSAAQDQALNTSEAGLAGMVEEYANKVYPGTSMMIVLARVMLQRMAVLSIFPSARATADNQQIQAGLGYLQASVNVVSSYIQSANQVHVASSTVTTPPPPKGGGSHTFWVVQISYSNILGDKTYTKTVLNSQSLQAAMQAAQPYIAQAEQVQAQGLAEDLAYAQVTNLEQIIQDAATFLSG